MTSWVGKSIAHYRVTSQIGAGGMGEVYRASDSRLGRDVAIKVLPAEFASDPERMARFEREAKLLASLSHANIASIFGIEDIDGARALVMELVEGPTLADRIAKGALAPEEALPIAKQIAEALEYAHERAIIHRDLKPANVKLTPDGTVKVLDFGLAKALSDDPTGSGSDLSKSPTLTAASTRLGVILGTAAYMSPEQAKGKIVDRRADIWAFGSLLFEMLTARQAFAGETVSETLASVIKDEPDWSALPASTPERVRDVLRRCLVKDPKQRLRDIGDARIRIEEEIAGKPDAINAAATTTAALARRGVAAWALAATAMVAIAIGAAAGYRMHAPKKTPMVRAMMNLADGMQIDPDDIAFVLAPDGRTLALAANGKDEPQRLWLRRLDRADATRLDGTDGAAYPFWSPDGRTIGFFADRKLKRVAADGGLVQTICDAPDGRGAAWGPDGTIVFSPGPLDGLNRVPATGGTPEAITTLDSTGVTHRLPVFLPDGKRVLFVVGTNSFDKGDVECLDIATKKRTRLFKSDSQVCVVDANHLAYVIDNSLVVQEFNPGSLKLEGRPSPVAQNIQFNPYRHAADFDLSPSGAMVWYGRVNSQASQLTWYDFDGRELGKLGELGPTVMMNFSPDGRRLVTCDRTDHFDLGMYDVGSGVRTRFTLGPAPAAYPVFSRDGKTVFYGDGVGTILARASDGSGEARTLISQPTVSMWTGPETPDGSGIIIMSQRPKTAFDIGVLPLAPGAQIRDLIAGPGSQSNPAFSPDGRWLAYDTDESGRSEVVVVRYPSLSGRWQVSTQGGNTPLWMPDGRSIVYGTDDAHLMRTGVDGRGEGLVVETTERIFGGKTLPGPIMIAPDGKRILVIVPANSAASQSINLVTDWRQLVGE
jgi:Tol biopolymer transport system component